MGPLEDGAAGRGMLAPGHGRVPSTPPELAVTDPFPASCHRASVKTLEAEILFLVLPLAGAGCGRQLGGVGGWKGDRRSGERQQCKGRGTGWGAGWEHQGCLGMGLGEGAWRNCPALEAGRGMLQLVLPLQGGDGRLGKERGRGWGVRWTPVMFPPYPPSREAWGWLGLWGGTSTGTGVAAGGAGKPQR